MNDPTPASSDTNTSRWLTALLIGGVRTPNASIDGLLLLARLYAGITIASAGHDKLPTPGWMADQVRTIGFPFPEFSATAACLTELAAGVLLATGLLTRPAALALAVVMGTASFGFHKVTPLTGMHIAQGFVWLFVVFLALGGGRWSLDGLIRRFLGRTPTRAVGVALALSAVPIAWAGFLEISSEPAPPTPSTADLEIRSVSLAGSFNEWDLEATLMTQDEGGSWIATVPLATPGIVELKFALNGSWDVNLGENDAPPTTLPRDGTVEPNGGNIRFAAPAPGRYRIALEPDSANYTIAAEPPSVE